MNNRKKLIIISVIILVAAIALALVGWYIGRFHDLTIELQRDNIAVTITDQQGNEIQTIEQNTSLRLVDGVYLLQPSSTDTDRPISNDSITVTLDGDDQTVVVDPELSADYRSQIARQNAAAIRSALTNQHPLTDSTFYQIIHIEILGEQADWAVVVIDQQMPPGATGDTYFALLQQQGDDWQLKTDPELVLTAHKYPDIPADILSASNQLYDSIESYRAD